MSRPWMKFYPADWRDTKLRDCSLAARGLWMDLLTYAHEADPYGHLLINGKDPSVAQIALHVARPLPEVKKALVELEVNGVFSRTDKGIIFSRRMVRDKARETQDSEYGKRGGNPKLMTKDKRGVNPPIKTEDNGLDKAQWTLDSSSLPSSATTLELKEGEEEQTCGKFALFWEKYPHKVGKKDAEAKFQKALKLVSFQRIMASLAAYCRKTDDRPWCNPATWLHQGRWDDEPAIQQHGGVLGALDRVDETLESNADSEAGSHPVLRLSAR